jgi:hypothetical protein
VSIRRNDSVCNLTDCRQRAFHFVERTRRKVDEYVGSEDLADDEWEQRKSGEPETHRDKNTGKRGETWLYSFLRSLARKGTSTFNPNQSYQSLDFAYEGEITADC